jgi:hypothetical protein
VGHHESAQFAQVGAHSQFIQPLFRRIIFQSFECLGRQGFEVLVSGRNANIVESIVTADGIGRIYGMEGNTPGFAVEKVPAGLRVGRDSLLVTG